MLQMKLLTLLCQMPPDEIQGSQLLCMPVEEDIL